MTTVYHACFAYEANLQNAFGALRVSSCTTIKFLLTYCSRRHFFFENHYFSFPFHFQDGIEHVTSVLVWFQQFQGNQPAQSRPGKQNIKYCRLLVHGSFLSLCNPPGTSCSSLQTDTNRVAMPEAADGPRADAPQCRELTYARAQQKRCSAPSAGTDPAEEVGSVLCKRG